MNVGLYASLEVLGMIMDGGQGEAAGMTVVVDFLSPCWSPLV